ncbi:MAG: glycosyltransferase [Burkholderiales bacterium]|nr:glycosyltransferase [Burkholderiales bacterium]
MKEILVIGTFETEDFGLHIAETLQAMQYKVIKHSTEYLPLYSGNKLVNIFNKGIRTISGFANQVSFYRQKRTKKLINVVSQHNLTYIICAHDLLMPDEVRQIKEITNAKICLWFPDTLANFNKAFFMNCDYDAIFFKDPFIIQAMFGVLNTPLYYMPECFNPARHKLSGNSSIDAKYNCDITTAGNAHSWRVAYYNHLVDYDVKIWGPQPPLWMPKKKLFGKFQCKLVHNEEKAKAFLGAKIVLNNLYFGEVIGVNVRTFEAAGIGAFQMVDWRSGLAQLFKDGEEIVSYKSLSEMHQKIKYYLEHPELREKIATAGKARAYLEHTYEHRLNLIIKTLDGSASGFPIV